ncbi:hypothetical protein [Streptomyces sp. NPDC005407]|uniref:hypothetical protein n=1 Tax=Streptomyces sp. NPDC005407 TaxID=3155340 RepID=UPI0033AA01B2
MARKTSAAQEFRDELTAAAARLRESGSDRLAAAVDKTLTPEGHKLLRVVNWESQAADSPNLPIRMSPADRDRIKAGAAAKATALKASGEAASWSVTDDVNEGLAAFAEGRFSPAPPPRSAYGSGEDKVNLNVRPDAGLRARAKQAAQDRAEELGWTPKVMHIASAWLLHIYPAPAPKPTRRK